MDGQACTSCGAQNPDDAAHCWQCYQRFTHAYSPPASIFRGLNQRLDSGYRGHTAVVTPTRSLSTISIGIAKRVALVMAVWVVGSWIWGAISSGFPFPEMVAGEERVESALVDSGVKLVQEMLDATGLNVEVSYAFYGSDTEPTYMMFVVQSDDENVQQLLETQPTGVELSASSVECSRDFTGSMCLWQREHAMVGLYGWGQADGVLRVAAEYARADMA
jgi:hypothetical protein